MSSKTVLTLLTAAAVATVVLFATVVPAGAPYDEPSHFSTVEFVATHHRIPELGKPGVTYEASQPPLYYVTAGAVMAAVDGLGASRKTAFYVVRLVTAALIAAIALMTRRLAQLWLGPETRVANAAAAFVAVAPGLAAIATSVQNDSLAITLGLGSVLIALDRPANGRTGLISGCLGGLAVLAKLSSVPALLVAAVPLALRAPKRLVPLASFGGGVTMTAGWWFVRNRLLYGDITGRAGLDLVGFPATHGAFPGVRELPGLARAAVAHLWFPSEYYRNVFGASFLFVVLVLLITALLVLGFGRAAPTLVRRPIIGPAMGLWALASLTFWLLARGLSDASLGLRHTFSAFPAVAVTVVACGDSVARRWGPAVVLGVALLIDVSLLVQLAAEPKLPFHLW